MGQLMQLEYEPVHNLRRRKRDVKSALVADLRCYQIAGGVYMALPQYTEEQALDAYKYNLNRWNLGPVSGLPTPHIYSEIMDDVLLEKGADVALRSRYYHYCYHSTCTAKCVCYATTAYAGGYSNKWYVKCLSYGWPSSAEPIQTGFYPSSAFAHPDIRRARYEAYDTMVPKFESDFDLSMFIWELKDFRRLVTLGLRLVNARRQWKALELLQREGRKLAGGSPSKSLGSGVDLTVGAFLSYNLAYAPLIKDIRNLIKSTRDFHNNAREQFEEAGEQYNTSYHSATAVTRDESSPLSNHFWISSGRLDWAKYTAFMSYKYFYPMRDALDALIPYFGMDITIDDVWNMIPLSFVIDYVWKLGKALQLMDRSTSAAILDPVFGESVVHYSQSGLFLAQDKVLGGAHTVVNGKIVKGGYPLLSGYEAKNYLRLPVKGLARRVIPHFSNPNNKQKLIGMALALSFLRR